MAIDSRNKRASALNSMPLVIYPTADGVTDNNDRQQITWLYFGQTGTEVIVITSVTPSERTIIIRRDNRTMIIESEDRTIKVPFERRVV